MNHQAPADASPNGALFVLAEIDAGGALNQAEYFLKLAVRFQRDNGLLQLLHRDREIGIELDPDELARDLGRRQDEIHSPRGDGAMRHPSGFRGLLVLRKSNAALAFDGSYPLSAIRRASGKHDGYRVRPLIGGERFKENVDRIMRLVAFRPRRQMQRAIANDHYLVGRDDVDVVPLNGHSFFGLNHRHGSGSRENFSKLAFIVGLQMLNNYECHAGLRRQRVQ